MNKLFKLGYFVALALIALSCNDRFVPENISDIEARDAATKVYAPADQQTRLFNALNATLIEFNGLGDLSYAVSTYKNVSKVVSNWKWDESAAMQNNLKVLEEIISRFNSMSSLSGSTYSSLYALSVFSGDYYADSTGLYMKPRKGGIKVELKGACTIEAKFSSAEKEYRIGVVDSLPVAINFIPKNGSSGAGGYSGGDFKISYTKEPSDLTVKLPKSVAVTVLDSVGKEIAKLDISLDADYKGTLIDNYFTDKGIEKALDEISLNMGMNLNVGGVGLTVNKLAYGKGNLGLGVTFSKDKTGLLAFTCDVEGVKLKEKNATKAGTLADAVIVRKEEGDEPEVSFLGIIETLLGVMECEKVSAYLNCIGLVQAKGEIVDFNDFMSNMEVLQEVKQGGVYSDSTKVINALDALKKDVTCKFYFGSDIEQSELTFFHVGNIRMDDDFYFGPGIKFVGVDAPVTFASLFGNSPMKEWFVETEDFLEAYPLEAALTARGRAAKEPVMNLFQKIEKELQKILKGIKK
ncbi:MAG: hypothetical protein MJY44_02205 [Bacteroidales bacterium]|nr:hypothetical protein [Bacteroidales bacterium]